jgi:hypothetical protein
MGQARGAALPANTEEDGVNWPLTEAEKKLLARLISRHTRLFTKLFLNIPQSSTKRR